jgi:hypothetical protein
MSMDAENIVGIRIQAMTVEDTEEFLCALVNCIVCELAINVWLLIDMICKWSENQIINSNSRLYV